MCAICGSYVFSGSSTIDPVPLRQLRDAMTARGPDAAGEWLSADARIWMGHRRLSIIDLSERGAQPMVSADGSVVLSFNGEIYNYRQLRRDLEARGHRFRGNSDTEVILESYRSKGPDCVKDLRGMFAFALWDQAKQELMLARDPYGIKPLYYSAKDGRVTFASSVKALAQCAGMSRELDPAGVAGFFVFGSVPEPWTVYRSITAVPAGTTLTIGPAGPQPPRPHRSITQTIVDGENAAAQRPLPLEAATHEMRAALLDSVRHHLVSDVPIGVFLSAGTDSSSLVGLMRDAGHDDIQTITLAYSEFSGALNDEAPIAQAAAGYYGTRHQRRDVGAKEFQEDLPRILAAMDQPSIDGINSWFVSKAAKELGLKVAISGVGGDELVGGYSTFRNLPKLTRLLSRPAKIAGLAGLLGQAVTTARGLGFGLHPKHAGLLRYGGNTPGSYLLQRGLFLPSEFRHVLADRDFLAEGLRELDPIGLLTRELAGGPKTSIGQIAALESVFYLRNQLLRDADWAGMAHSLEVRTPLVDHVLLAKVAPLMMRPNPPPGKAMLAAAPARPVPSFITSRERTGFGIPLQSWLEQTSALAATKLHPKQPFSRHWARYIAEWNEFA